MFITPTAAQILADAVRRIEAGAHAAPRPDAARRYKSLARGTLAGMARSRRAAFAPHLMRAATRRRLAAALALAALYRRRAAHARREDAA